MIRRLLILLLLLVLFGAGLQSGYTQDSNPVPTLVPPTLVPNPGANADVPLLTESGVARIVRDGKVRVGILFNAPPFGELNIRGEVTGFDADLARALAEAWDVDVEFSQVTRQTAFDVLDGGQVDMLIAAQVHRRELDSRFEFSQSYFISSQSVMVRNDDTIQHLNEFSGRANGVGVVLGGEGADAYNVWMRRVTYTVPVHTYLTLDQAYVALISGEIDGVIDNINRLRSVAIQPDLVRFMDEIVEPEPYAVVVRRQDVNLRNLVNRTLQYLLNKGTIEDLRRKYVPEQPFDVTSYPLWLNVGDDAPKPDQFPQDVPYPAQYFTPRLLSDRVIRVAGLADLPPDATESQQRIDTLNRSIMDAMAARWGATVQYIPNSAANALDLVASGQADLALGVAPDWNWADRVDFTAPYFLHGDRLIVRTGSDITGFGDLRGKWVAVPISDPSAGDRALGWAQSVNVQVQIYQSREQDIAFSILHDNNADVAFGDSLMLLAHVQANPDALAFTSRWYSRIYTAFAVPRNDLDFKLLVDYTLQELARDGTLQTIISPLLPPGSTLSLDQWPGSGDFMGFSLRTSAG